MTNVQTQEFKPDPNFKRKDIHQEVTDTILKKLETGVVPWQQPWKAEKAFNFQIPKNFLTQNRYRGINILLLWCSGYDNAFVSNEWATFKQWQEKKEAVRKNEKGTMIVYYDTFEKEVDGELKEIPFLKCSYVFNRCQLASWVSNELPNEPDQKSYVERVDYVEQFISNTNASVTFGGSQACYNRKNDQISMPDPEEFIDTDSCSATEGFYSTLVHELTHWTGHSSRLNRDLGKKFGDKEYAVEELVAELGAAFLCTEFGIARAEKEHQASYISNWIKVLKENKGAIVAAASEASKATDYLYGLQPQ